jgi:hypothetical protein
MSRTTRIALASAFVGAVVAWWAATSASSPIAPRPNRPVLTAFARLTRTAARLGLWFALAADPPPAAKPTDERQKLVKAPSIGPDGAPAVDHAEGW